MEAYILLALLITDSPRPATWTAEFTTKERCAAAGKALQEMKTGYRVMFVCTAR